MFTATDVLNAEFVEQPLNKLWSLISPLYMVDESQWLEQLLPLATPTAGEKAQCRPKRQSSLKLSVQIKSRFKWSMLYCWNTVWIPKNITYVSCRSFNAHSWSATADALIRDKLSAADWKFHLKSSDSVFVNADMGPDADRQSRWFVWIWSTQPVSAVNRLVNKMSGLLFVKPCTAMKVMGHQFVLGRSIAEAQKWRSMCDKGFTYSYDMLGEAALTTADADKYFNDYLMAIEAVGRDRYGIETSPARQYQLNCLLHPLRSCQWRASADWTCRYTHARQGCWIGCCHYDWCWRSGSLGTFVKLLKSVSKWCCERLGCLVLWFKRILNVLFLYWFGSTA